jgi:hypothetical protein
MAAEITVTTLSQTIRRGAVEGACELMNLILLTGAISPKSAGLSSTKGPKMPHRVI